MNVARELRGTARIVGVRGGIAYALKERVFRRLPGIGTYTLHSRESDHPLLSRTGSSDRDVFRQIFVEREYAPLEHIRDARFIIDCGANVGYASAYFLSRHPNARIAAIEPDPANFAMLRRNLAPYGDRVTLINSGVWSHVTGLNVRRGTFRDGKEWSTQVTESAPGEEPDLQAVDIGTVMRQANFDRIDILKIDIERAEAVVFARNFDEWLPKASTIVIELHDEECERIFHAALRSGTYRFSQSGELTIAERAAGA